MILTYNGVQLALTKTNAFVQQPVYSSDGATWICNRYMLDVTAVYNPGATSYAPGGSQSSGFLPAQTDVNIRHALKENRRQLTWSDEAGNLVLQSPPPGNSIDCIDGPKVIDVSVRQISGSKTWLVRFAVETFLRDCGGGPSGTNSDSSPDPVLSNRWSDTHHIGEDLLTTISYQGETWLRMDALEDLNRTADFYRNRVLPPVPQGFRRMDVNIQVVASGNRLIWTCVDQQQNVTLGDVATSKFPGVRSFRGMFGEQTTTANKGMAPGGLLSDVCAIHVEGRPNATRAGLIQFAVQMCLSKLQYPVPNFQPAGNGNAGAFPTHIEASESLSDPSVDFKMVVCRPVAQNGVQGMFGLRNDIFTAAGIQYQFGNPLLDNGGFGGNCPQLGADNNTRTDTYNALAFTQALQAACSSVPILKGSLNLGGSGASYDKNPPKVNTSYAPNAPTPPVTTSYSSANGSAPYSEYRVDARYDTDGHAIQMPTTGTVNGGPSGAEIVYTANPTSTAVFEWTAERAIAPPAVPNTKLYDPNYVLTDYMVQPTSFGLMADGQTKGYRVTGRYEYALKQPINPNDQLTFPASPMYAFIWGSDTLDNFQTGIIGGGSGGSSGGGGGTTAAAFVGTDH